MSIAVQSRRVWTLRLATGRVNADLLLLARAFLTLLWYLLVQGCRFLGRKFFRNVDTQADTEGVTTLCLFDNLSLHVKYGERMDAGLSVAYTELTMAVCSPAPC